MSSDDGSDPASSHDSDSDDLELEVQYGDSASEEDSNDINRQEEGHRDPNREDKQQQQDNDDEQSIQQIPQEQYKILQSYQPIKASREPLKQHKLEAGERITTDLITKYEFTKIIGLRARQISEGSALYVSLTEEQKRQLGVMGIAEQEFKQRKIPFMVHRVHPNGDYEEWKVWQMEK